MPSIEKLNRTYGPKGLHVVAVSIDDAVSEDSIRAFAHDLGLTFQILHDPTHRIEQAYQTTGYPETFVIGKDGIIRKKWIGAADWNSEGNRALIAQLLGLAPERLRLETPDTVPGSFQLGDTAAPPGAPPR
jgi:peroxiredoxin